MVLGSKKLGHLITKFERGGDDGPRQRKRLTPKSKQKKLVQDIEIGDKINLLDSPWKDSEGMYPCKAVRRPTFIESALVCLEGPRPSTRGAVLLAVLVNLAQYSVEKLELQLLVRIHLEDSE